MVVSAFDTSSVEAIGLAACVGLREPVQIWNGQQRTKRPAHDRQKGKHNVCRSAIRRMKACREPNDQNRTEDEQADVFMSERKRLSTVDPLLVGSTSRGADRSAETGRTFESPDMIQTACVETKEANCMHFERLKVLQVVQTYLSSVGRDVMACLRPPASDAEKKRVYFTGRSKR